MIPGNFDYQAPKNIDEALALIASNPEAKLLAGGHSLLPAMKLRLAQPALLVDLGRISGLSYVREAQGKIAVGAMTTHSAIAESSLLHAQSPLLAQAAKHIGDVQVRNRGTIGGSIAHADPAADYPAALLALDAEITAHSKNGERTIMARDFFSGLFSTALEPGEIIVEIRIPKTTGAGTAYEKFHHPASGFAVVGVAAVVRASAKGIESASIGVTGVATHAFRAQAVETALRGQPLSSLKTACARAAEGIDAIGDHFASSEYRRHLAAVYCERAVRAAAGRK
ncbi:MAG TPA: xanthine dehydrogenase family protein subunit M [Terriglobales bacterium]|nr:xanthine dehydrogenase family protein subunit M [Terriglobales bacterium]